MKVTASQYSMAPAIHQAGATEQTRTVSAEGMKIERAAAVDPVLGEAQTQLKTLPDVDMEKVNAMKDAISSGKVHVDLDALTEALQKYYQR